MRLSEGFPHDPLTVPYVPVRYVPPPNEFAVLAVARHRSPLTPFADHVLQSNVERRRYPDRDAPRPRHRVHIYAS